MKADLRTDHLALIARGYMRHSLRSGAGVVFLVLAMIAGIGLAAAAIAPVELAQKTGETFGKQDVGQRTEHGIETYGPKVLSMFTDANASQADYLLHDKPALASLFLVMLVAFLPFLVALSGFNQTAGDIGSKGLRYLLLRTERSNIFLGRLLGTYVFVLAVLATIVAVVALYLAVKVPFYSAGAVTTWMLHGFLACAIYAMPWTALCAWVSASLDTPLLALAVLEIGTIIWMIVVYAIGTSAPTVAEYAAYLAPLGWKWWLFDPSIPKVLAAGGAMLAFAAIFTVAGLASFDRRDL